MPLVGPLDLPGYGGCPTQPPSEELSWLFWTQKFLYDFFPFYFWSNPDSGPGVTAKRATCDHFLAKIFKTRQFRIFSIRALESPGNTHYLDNGSGGAVYGLGAKNPKNGLKADMGQGAKTGPAAPGSKTT